MTARGWSRRFDTPIEVGSRKLKTLREAGDFITALPKREVEREHWQLATKCLIDAADRGGILMLAEVAIRTALAHGKPEPTPEPRKKRARKHKIIG